MRNGEEMGMETTVVGDGRGCMYTETVGDGYRTCGNGWGWRQMYVPVQLSTLK